jgi:hypothetical protein
MPWARIIFYVIVVLFLKNKPVHVSKGLFVVCLRLKYTPFEEFLEGENFGCHAEFKFSIRD